MSHFISKLAEWSLPFFKVLWKLAKFTWDEKSKLAFANLKRYLESLPILYKLVAGELLWLYLTAREGAVSLVLLCQEGIVQ